VLNKIDYTVSPERYMGDEGALRLYYELDLLRSINISSRTLEESNRLEKIVDVLNARKLYIPDREQLLAKVLHCPHCNERLSESEILLRKCGNCHGLLKLDPQPVGKPFAGFEDWDACMRHMTKPKSEGGGGYDVETARRVCGSLQSEHEKK
jgi:transcription elongation factor Elf1